MPTDTGRTPGRTPASRRKITLYRVQEAGRIRWLWRLQDVERAIADQMSDHDNGEVTEVSLRYRKITFEYTGIGLCAALNALEEEGGPSA